MIDYTLLNYLCSHDHVLLVGVIFTHLGTGEFRVWRGAWANAAAPFPPLILQGSVEAHYTINPSYRVVTYNRRNLVLEDWSVYRADIFGADNGGSLLWEKLYSFQETYGSVSSVTNSVLQSVQDRLFASYSNTSLFATYWYQRKAGLPLPVNPSGWFQPPQMKSNALATQSNSGNSGQHIAAVCVLQSFSAADVAACMAAQNATS